MCVMYGLGVGRRVAAYDFSSNIIISICNKTRVLSGNGGEGVSIIFDILNSPAKNQNLRCQLD